MVVGVVAVAGAALLLRAAPDDVSLLALYLVGSGAASLVIGYGGLALLSRLGIGGLRLRLAFGGVLVIAVAFVNVVVTALLMFISAHDLGLLGLLLFFAAILAIFFALAVADPLVASVRALTRAANRMSGGDLTVRVPADGRDEVGELARAFNAMAGQIAGAARERESAEAALRDLVAAVSHDLRTPLASIRAMVEAINDHVVTDRETVDRYLGTIGSEVERLAQLIDDLFELSQIDAGQLRLQVEDGSLHDLISDTLRSLSAQAERRRVALVGRVDETLPHVRLDPARAQRVLDNLVGNALRHTAAGGRVELGALERPDEVEVTVRDTGEGIAPEELARVFEPFYRGERERSRSAGAGLGLTIARGIVTAHGGRIWAESTVGAGTTFHFTLPRSTTGVNRA
ncbi:MAG TPA: HAMP domain-containing sensor histidine kinase [Chloroflexota bacterium]